MRSSAPHLLDQRENFLSPGPYAPKIHLTPEIAKEVLQISAYASLGFHIAELVKLSNGEICAFTEWYPAAAIPCNGGNASSLFEVGQLGGPALPAHEIQLEIVGASSMQQIRAVRRIRGIIPELQKFEVKDQTLILTYAERDTQLPYNDLQTILGYCAQSFGHGREVKFVESASQLHEPISFNELDRLALRKIASMAWADSRGPQKGEKAKLPGKDARYRHIQTVLFDIPDSAVTLIEQGPPKGHKTGRAKWHIEDQWLINLHSSRCDGNAWHDTARSTVLKFDVIPEGIRVVTRGHDLFITALLPEEDARYLKHCRGTNEFPFATRISAISNERALSRELFELVPSGWHFRGYISSHCDSKILIEAESTGQPALSAHQQADIELRLRRKIFFDHNRYAPVSLGDPLVSDIIKLIPFNSVILGANQCVVTGGIELHTVHPIPQRQLTLAKETVGVAITNKVATARPPCVIEDPVTIIRGNTAAPSQLKPVSDRGIRTLRVTGGAEGIGGSALSLGNIFLDCGAHPRTSAKRKHSAPFPQNLLSSAEVAFITHAHLDHVGSAVHLKKLDIPIFMHHATALVSWPLLGEQIGLSDGFNRRELEAFYRLVRPVPFGHKLALSDTISATMVEAGHLAGSAMVIVEHQTAAGPWRAMYTGDLQSDSAANHNRIYPSAAKVSEVDALIIEATNGMSTVGPRAELEEQLIANIEESLESGGRVVMPAIASRAPELLTLLTKYRERFRVPIYIDGRALEISNDIHGYISHLHPDLFIQRTRADQGWHGVGSGNFKRVPLNGESRFLKDPTPRIVVASGGMGQGTAERHIKAARPKDTVIFTCYQAPGTYGHSLLRKYQSMMHQSRATGSTAEADSAEIWTGPRILSQRLSGHISGEQLLCFVKDTLKPNGTVVLVHGGDDEKVAVKAALTEQNHAGKIIIARTGQEIQL